ncbi:hypothetical protein RRG08_062303 [Elysia crispata]|uniref:Uncharacterized protein n=1 Tax=Elysia crispata TaxID=231223 RepID=A0AAE0YG41_9GAST|nr:hypothetical protein RRG08_062303 [Elysia crispata]
MAALFQKNLMCREELDKAVPCLVLKIRQDDSIKGSYQVSPGHAKLSKRTISSEVRQVQFAVERVPWTQSYLFTVSVVLCQQDNLTIKSG